MRPEKYWWKYFHNDESKLELSDLDENWEKLALYFHNCVDSHIVHCVSPALQQVWNKETHGSAIVEAAHAEIIVVTIAGQSRSLRAAFKLWWTSATINTVKKSEKGWHRPPWWYFGEKMTTIEGTIVWYIIRGGFKNPSHGICPLGSYPPILNC